jgi:hypothetical protein
VLLEVVGRDFTKALTKAGVQDPKQVSRIASILAYGAEWLSGPTQILVVPIEAAKVGGSDKYLMPTTIAMTWTSRSGIQALTASIAVSESQRSSLPEFTVRDAIVRLATIGTKSIGEAAYDVWREFDPFIGGAGIANYAVGSIGDRWIPIVVFLGSYNDKPTEEAVPRFFGKSQKALVSELTTTKFRYELREFRPGYPKTLVVLVTDTSTLEKALQNDKAFQAKVEEFYSQKFGAVVP